MGRSWWSTTGCRRRSRRATRRGCSRARARGAAGGHSAPARRWSCCCPARVTARRATREAVRYHYDVGNDFFALFLDESMTYSCALFSRGAQTLAEAQHAKLDLIAQKLELRARPARPGRRLRVGELRDPRRARVRRQRDGDHAVALAGRARPQRWSADAGLADRVEIRVADYRELTGEPYDAIASIGMAEHVGSRRSTTTRARCSQC